MNEVLYNPNFSIDQNARVNGVSVATIRKYIKEKGIDRRFDEKLKIFNKIKALQKLHKECPVSKLAKLSGYSLNTVKKYLLLPDFSFEVSPDKYSAFDLGKCRNIIKSVSSSQTTILSSILQLYIHNDHYECDFTYSKGIFWKRLQQPKLKYDKYPQEKGVRKLDEAYALPDSSLNNCVVDLPFLMCGSFGKNSINERRFSSFSTETELYETNYAMIKLAYQKLKRGGFLIMKTMDVSYALKQLWVSDYVVQTAKQIGFELKDKFILVAKRRPLHKGDKQHMARKLHSYFFVFRKR